MIGWYVHHQGLGHLTRLQAVAEHLESPVTGITAGTRRLVVGVAASRP